MASGGTPAAAPCTVLHGCSDRVPSVVASGGFQHLSMVTNHNHNDGPVEEEEMVTGGNVFSDHIMHKVALKIAARPTSQFRKRPTSDGDEKQQSPPSQQAASALKESHECPEESNRMRERLFRMLSKVPIQVESQLQLAHDRLASSCCQDTASFASSSSSSVTCSSSTSSSAVSSHQQQQPKPVIDREPLIIKYYHERSLEEILELHFGCSLIKHRQNDFTSGAYEQQNYGPQIVTQHEVSDQPHYQLQQQQQQFGNEVHYQAWQPPSAFANSMAGANYSWHAYDAIGGFSSNNNNNNKISSSTAIASNGNDKCNRGDSHQQSSRRTKDGNQSGRQVAKRVRGKRSLNSAHSQASSLLQPVSSTNTTTEVGSVQQHPNSPASAIFTASDSFHQPALAAPNQYGGHHHHLYAYQSPVDTSGSSDAGMLSFNQAAQGEPSFVGQGEFASSSCHYNNDLQPHQQASANYYQPPRDLIYQQVHSANLYTPPVPLEAVVVSDQQHQFQHHHQHHFHRQQQQQQPMIEPQQDYVAEPHRIAFYSQAEAVDGSAAGYVLTSHSESSYSGQQPGEMVCSVPGKWQAVSDLQSNSQ